MRSTKVWPHADYPLIEVDEYLKHAKWGINGPFLGPLESENRSRLLRRQVSEAPWIDEFLPALACQWARAKAQM